MGSKLRGYVIEYQYAAATENVPAGTSTYQFDYGPEMIMNLRDLLKQGTPVLRIMKLMEHDISLPEIEQIEIDPIWEKEWLERQAERERYNNQGWGNNGIAVAGNNNVGHLVWNPDPLPAPEPAIVFFDAFDPGILNVDIPNE